MARKYNNSKVTVDGIAFDSRREAKRYREISLMLQLGEIRNLELQKRFELIPAQWERYERYGKRGQRLKDGRRCVEKGVVYVADFVYEKDGKIVVEDAKGCRRGTAYDVFVLKRKLMLHVYGIKVQEV